MQQTSDEEELNEAEIYFLRKNLDRETRESAYPGYILATLVFTILLIWINK